MESKSDTEKADYFEYTEADYIANNKNSFRAELLGESTYNYLIRIRKLEYYVGECGDGIYIALGAVILERVRIAVNAVIVGTNAVVAKDIAERETV